MSNFSIPYSFVDLTKTAGGFIKGLTTYEVAIGITQNTAATIQKDLDLASILHAEHKTIKAERASIFYPALRKADSEGRGFITRAKKSLAVHLGEEWSEAWIVAGFKDNSTQTPKSSPAREKLLGKLAGYFAAQPDQEVAEFGVNAVRAGELHGAISAARANLESQAKRQKAAKSALDNALSTLRKRLRAAIAELDLKLEADSDLWGAFGLTPPAQKNRRKAKPVAAKTETPARKTETTGVVLGA